MYTRILVALNDPEFSDLAISQALRFASESKARLLLLYVMGKAKDLNYECETDADAEEQSETCLAKLRAQGDKVRESGSIADLRLLSGDVGQQICETAARWGADLVLIGHQGFLTSSHQVVVNYVINHAPCAVLILPISSQPSDVAAMQHRAVS